MNGRQPLGQPSHTAVQMPISCDGLQWAATVGKDLSVGLIMAVVERDH